MIYISLTQADDGVVVINFLDNILFCFVQSVAQDWAIEAMPTFIFLKEGKIVDKVVGANKDQLQQKIELHSSELVQTA